MATSAQVYSRSPVGNENFDAFFAIVRLIIMPATRKTWPMRLTL